MRRDYDVFMADANDTTVTFPRTIARNARVLVTVLETAVSCKSYTLHSNFVGTPVSLDWLRANLRSDIKTFSPRIRQDSPTKFSVNYHSNYWLEIETA
jgi:hypothetical protein